MKKLLAVGILSLSLLTANAFAATPSESSLRELAKLSQVEPTFKENFKDSFVTLSSEVLANTIARQNPTITPTQIQGIKDIVKARMTPVADELYVQFDFEQNIMPIYLNGHANNYTQDEVDALIRLYRTPEGQSIAAKQAKVQREFMQATMPKTMQIANDYINSGKNKALFTDIGKQIGQYLQKSSAK